ncbi:MAG: metal-dependent hydrolase [Candidatus Baldrarchaeia archaeon]
MAVKLTFLGHAAFKIDHGDKTILIDPFITGNPLCPIKVEDIRKCDIILVTHDHGDHLGDTIKIAKNTGAKVVAIYDLGVFIEKNGVTNVIGMNIGGSTDIDGIKVTMVKAFHSAERGAPVGYIIRLGNVAIYHAGDTDVFYDMKLIGDLYRPDVALLPISGYYTMGPLEAAYATQLIKPKIAIPMHYNTFPVIKQDPNVFAENVKKLCPEVEVKILNPGETITIG